MFLVSSAPLYIVHNSFSFIKYLQWTISVLVLNSVQIYQVNHWIEYQLEETFNKQKIFFVFIIGLGISIDRYAANESDTKFKKFSKINPNIVIACVCSLCGIISVTKSIEYHINVQVYTLQFPYELSNLNSEAYRDNIKQYGEQYINDYWLLMPNPVANALVYTLQAFLLLFHVINDAFILTFNLAMDVCLWVTVRKHIKQSEVMLPRIFGFWRSCGQ